jgi:hypothetical protein
MRRRAEQLQISCKNLDALAGSGQAEIASSRVGIASASNSALTIIECE